MLDTKAKNLIEPTLNFIANIYISHKISPNTVTIQALIIGIFAAITVALNHPVIGVALLFLSGLLDSVDGVIARKTNSSSAWGTVLDIVFDRIVEIFMLWAIVILDRCTIVATAIVLSTIIISMTIFLTVGAVAPKVGQKSFYYQTGLAERSEGFIMLSLAALISNYRFWILIVFAGMILFTAVQRLLDAKRILK